MKLKALLAKLVDATDLKSVAICVPVQVRQRAPILYAHHWLTTSQKCPKCKDGWGTTYYTNGKFMAPIEQVVWKCTTCRHEYQQCVYMITQQIIDFDKRWKERLNEKRK